MIERYLKPIFPRSLMGRAALILLLPVAGLLLAVSAAVIQRHYDRVTRQMTADFARTAGYVVAEVGAAADPGARLAELGVAFDLDARLGPGALPVQGWLPPWELSARVAERALAEAFPDRLALAVGPRDVALVLPTGAGPLNLDFPLSRLTASNPHQLLVLTLAAALLMTLIAYQFLRNQMRPIRRLARAAEAFGQGETLPMHVSGATEVRAAARAFLDMRERIEAQIEGRTLMLSGVSHDLRTPLTRMRLALSLMEGEPEAEALTQDLAQMEALIDRYLDYVRDGASEPVAQVDLAALVAERVARAGAGVSLRPGAAPTGVRVRQALFGRALDNLIGNAQRYGGRAEVWIDDGPDGVAVCVEDDGPGIPADSREQALRPFVRLDAARGAGGGVGLGLAIVADAMRSHGGRVVLGQGTSPGLGGLLARLELPADQRSSAAQTGV